MSNVNISTILFPSKNIAIVSVGSISLTLIGGVAFTVILALSPHASLLAIIMPAALSGASGMVFIVSTAKWGFDIYLEWKKSKQPATDEPERSSKEDDTNPSREATKKDQEGQQSIHNDAQVIDDLSNIGKTNSKPTTPTPSPEPTIVVDIQAGEPNPNVIVDQSQNDGNKSKQTTPTPSRESTVVAKNREDKLVAETIKELEEVINMLDTDIVFEQIVKTEEGEKNDNINPIVLVIDETPHEPLLHTWEEKGKDKEGEEEIVADNPINMPLLHAPTVTQSKIEVIVARKPEEKLTIEHTPPLQPQAKPPRSWTKKKGPNNETEEDKIARKIDNKNNRIQQLERALKQDEKPTEEIIRLNLKYHDLQINKYENRFNDPKYSLRTLMLASSQISKWKNLRLVYQIKNCALDEEAKKTLETEQKEHNTDEQLFNICRQDFDIKSSINDADKNRIIKNRNTDFSKLITSSEKNKKELNAKLQIFNDEFLSTLIKQIGIKKDSEKIAFIEETLLFCSGNPSHEKQIFVFLKQIINGEQDLDKKAEMIRKILEFCDTNPSLKQAATALGDIIPNEIKANELKLSKTIKFDEKVEIYKTIFFLCDTDPKKFSKSKQANQKAFNTLIDARAKELKNPKGKSLDDLKTHITNVEKLLELCDENSTHAKKIKEFSPILNTLKINQLELEIQQKNLHLRTKISKVEEVLKLLSADNPLTKKYKALLNNLFIEEKEVELKSLTSHKSRITILKEILKLLQPQDKRQAEYEGKLKTSITLRIVELSKEVDNDETKIAEKVECAKEIVSLAKPYEKSDDKIYANFDKYNKVLIDLYLQYLDACRSEKPAEDAAPDEQAKFLATNISNITWFHEQIYILETNTPQANQQKQVALEALQKERVQNAKLYVDLKFKVTNEIWTLFIDICIGIGKSVITHHYRSMQQSKNAHTLEALLNQFEPAIKSLYASLLNNQKKKELKRWTNGPRKKMDSHALVNDPLLIEGFYNFLSTGDLFSVALKDVTLPEDKIIAPEVENQEPLSEEEATKQAIAVAEKKAELDCKREVERKRLEDEKVKALINATFEILAVFFTPNNDKRPKGSTFFSLTNAHFKTIFNLLDLDIKEPHYMLKALLKNEYHKAIKPLLKVKEEELKKSGKVSEATKKKIQEKKDRDCGVIAKKLNIQPEFVKDVIAKTKHNETPNLSSELAKSIWELWFKENLILSTVSEFYSDRHGWGVVGTLLPTLINQASGALNLIDTIRKNNIILTFLPFLSFLAKSEVPFIAPSPFKPKKDKEIRTIDPLGFIMPYKMELDLLFPIFKDMVIQTFLTNSNPQFLELICSYLKGKDIKDAVFECVEGLRACQNADELNAQKLKEAQSKLATEDEDEGEAEVKDLSTSEKLRPYLAEFKKLLETVSAAVEPKSEQGIKKGK